MSYLILGLVFGIVVAVLVYFFLNKNIKILSEENNNLKNDLNDKNAQIGVFIGEKARLQSEIENADKKLATQKEEILHLREELNKEFRLLANQIFEEKTQKFSQVNEEKLSNILKPLKENIEKFEKKVDATYNAETREKAALKKELEQIININRRMSDDAQRLTLALKGDSKAQGDWGEWQLELLLEKSGLQKGVHFLQQPSFKTDEGANLRPDYIVNLPDNKHYIIDSKVSLTAYERYYNADNEELKARFLQEHIKSIQQHINDLGAKNYQNLYDINSPDFVFLFVALEPALTAALQHDNTLFEKAFAKNIVLVSTTTLLASLRTVSFIWRQENQKNNVLEIAKIGGQLYDKFVLFVENMIKVGTNMDTAKKTYSDAMNQLVKQNADGSYNAGTIIGQAETLKQLGAKATKNLPQAMIDRALIE